MACCYIASSFSTSYTISIASGAPDHSLCAHPQFSDTLILCLVPWCLFCLSSSVAVAPRWPRFVFRVNRQDTVAAARQSKLFFCFWLFVVGCFCSPGSGTQGIKGFLSAADNTQTRPRRGQVGAALCKIGTPSVCTCVCTCALYSASTDLPHNSGDVRKMF